MFPRILLSLVIILALAGCATTKKTAAVSEVEELRTKVSDLEKQLQDKDEEVRDLEERLSKIKMPDSEEIVNAQEVDISKVTPKNIQTALKNGGFYSGAIDGKIGRKTKEAIKEFQKANGLKSDGIVGKQTWMALQKHLK
ncbi:MAG: peptidoglycan-binding domain-containing protein [Candidatus Omnitrophota bacterium]|jgi:murein L,D-transpeptidase YcbB/YkuD